MKRWFKALAVATLAMAVAAPVLAQNTAKAAKGAKGPAKKIEAALAKLTLTSEQKPKVDEAVKAFKSEVEKVNQEAGTPQEKRPKIRSATKGLQSKLSTILTSEQQKQFQDAMGAKKKKQAQ